MGLRILNQLAFRTFQVGACLGDLPLEEVAGAVRCVVAPLQARIDEAVGDPVSDLCGGLRVVGGVAEADELSFFRFLNRDSTGDLPGRGFKPVLCFAALRDEIGIGSQIKFLRDALGKAAALQQTNLRHQEVPAVDLLGAAILAVILIHHFDVRRIDLKRDKSSV